MYVVPHGACCSNGFNFDSNCAVFAAITTHDNKRENENKREGEVPKIDEFLIGIIGLRLLY